MAWGRHIHSIPSWGPCGISQTVLVLLFLQSGRNEAANLWHAKKKVVRQEMLSNFNAGEHTIEKS